MSSKRRMWSDAAEPTDQDDSIPADAPLFRRNSDPFGLCNPEPRYAPNSLSPGGWMTDEDGYEI